MARKAGSNGEETARRIRDAAVRLFARHGYAAVSMRDIAAEVGLQAAALYNHFPNKQAMLLDVMASHMRALIVAWEKESFAFADPAEALRGFVRFHLQYHMDKVDHVSLAYHELKSLEPANYHVVEGLRRLYEGHLRKILTVGKEKGIFSVPDVPIAAMAILSMLTGASGWYRPDGRLSLDRLVDLHAGLVQRGLEYSPANRKESQVQTSILVPA